MRLEALDTFFLVVFPDFGRWFFCAMCFWFVCLFVRLFVFLFVCLSWAALEMIFAYFVLPAPSLSVGAGQGNQATHLWHRTRFQSCGLGLGGSWRLPCDFSSRVWYSLLAFPCIFLVFPPVAGGWAMALVDDLFLPLKARFPFHFFYVLCRLRCLAVQRCGSGC